MGQFDGKVALISGAARGQGRSHAVRLAEEGADIIAFDLCADLPSVQYPLATPADLEETVNLVEKAGGRIVARPADVRDYDAVQAVYDAGIAEFGRIDFVLGNAGVLPDVPEITPNRQGWYDAIDIMLTGVFNVIEVAVPRLIEQGEGGSIILTSSTAGLRSPGKHRDVQTPGSVGYVAAKHGVVGLMRTYANTLGPHSIRVNTIHPTGVATGMIMNEAFTQFVADHPEVTVAMQNVLPVEVLEPGDISNAVVFLCSDAGRYITGVTLPVDAGFNNS